MMGDQPTICFFSFLTGSALLYPFSVDLSYSASRGPGPGPGPLQSNTASVQSRNMFWTGLGICSVVFVHFE